MRPLRTAAGEYQEEDVYSMGVTGLFWARTPSTSLMGVQAAGIRKSKSRVTVVLCCNANGADKLPPVIIHTSENPRALEGVNIGSLGAEWKSNNRACITNLIMMEWLDKFYRHVGDRKVLLLVDNLSVHMSALNICHPPLNITVLSQPVNLTGKFHPFDLGIAENFKREYKRQWLRFIVEQYQLGEEPLDKMSTYYALKWIVQSWFHDVISVGIRNCFLKSAAIEEGRLAALPNPMTSMNNLYVRVQRAGGIIDAMSIESFLNPPGELVTDEALASPLQLADASLLMPLDEESHETDDGPPRMSLPNSVDAIKATQSIIQYLETQPEYYTAELRTLERIERLIKASEV